MRATVSLPRHLILADENPDREKDRLERYDHREQVKREGIERFEARYPPAVDQDPAREPHEMGDCKERGAGSPGDGAGDSLARRARLQLLLLQPGDLLHVKQNL